MTNAESIAPNASRSSRWEEADEDCIAAFATARRSNSSGPADTVAVMMNEKSTTAAPCASCWAVFSAWLARFWVRCLGRCPSSLTAFCVLSTSLSTTSGALATSKGV